MTYPEPVIHSSKAPFTFRRACNSIRPTLGMMRNRRGTDFPCVSQRGDKGDSVFPVGFYHCGALVSQSLTFR